MAKFALVGYGRDGRGVGKTEQGYTYVVNDNVRTGDVIQPIATSRAGKKFVTTGKINHAYKESSAKGQIAKQEVTNKGVDVTQAYTGAETGLSRKGVTQQQYQQDVRGANIEMYKRANPDAKFSARAQQTYEEYSKKFMEGKNE